MISIKRFDLNDLNEWKVYIEIYNKYFEETCSEDDDFQETVEFLNSEEYRTNILKVCNRDFNKFNVCRILKDDVFIGFCDYICYVDEEGKCVIGNFYLYPEFRNYGYGTECYNIMEKALIKLGGRYIDITPEEKAISFYSRKGFKKTKDISLENGEVAYRKML